MDIDLSDGVLNNKLYAAGKVPAVRCLLPRADLTNKAGMVAYSLKHPLATKDHGSRRNHAYWTTRAFDTTDPNTCNTFKAPAKRVS
ncbi:hypothetical protein GCM10009804_30540 [Kribbella hippodromi]|uniref:Uncharacterized protein n=1 Tax=Kribbella hippodromi TaxID=434347 RepID=A0ABN2D7R6_9ACTN